MRRWLSLVPISFCCSFLIIAVTWFVAHAVELDGVQVPDRLQVDGKTLYLNGFGLRTYSIFNVHIYAVGLYLEHLSSDPEQIIVSPETKLLTVRFEHDVDANQARNAWRQGLEKNCTSPCRLDPHDVEIFLAEVPAMHVNDTFHLLFEQNTATVTVNGKQLGTITHHQFAEAVLATFLGPDPASPALKQELLGGHS
jgi:hypothetical protein